MFVEQSLFLMFRGIWTLFCGCVGSTCLSELLHVRNKVVQKSKTLDHGPLDVLWPQTSAFEIVTTLHHVWMIPLLAVVLRQHGIRFRFVHMLKGMRFCFKENDS